MLGDGADRLVCNLTFSDQDHLDLRSDFQHDLLRSTYSSFDAPRQEEHDAVRMNVMPQMSQVITENRLLLFLKKSIFRVFPLDAKAGHLSETA